MLTDWTEVPDILKSSLPDGVRTFYMKITPVNHGPVLDLKTLTLIPGETKEQSRRMSVILVGDTFNTLQVGSISYWTGYDSYDPEEPFEKYINNEFEVLMEAYAGSEYVWDGMAQSLVP